MALNPSSSSNLEQLAMKGLNSFDEVSERHCAVTPGQTELLIKL